MPATVTGAPIVPEPDRELPDATKIAPDPRGDDPAIDSVVLSSKVVPPV